MEIYILTMKETQTYTKGCYLCKFLGDKCLVTDGKGEMKLFSQTMIMKYFRRVESRSEMGSFK
jgi:hypothetical protein